MATIVMQADQVIKEAEAVIDNIQQYRQRENEETIQRVMKKTFLGWKGFYKPNRQQAINWINGDGMWDYFWCYSYAGKEDKAKALILIAQHGDPVTLNEKDIQVLFG